MNSFRASCWQKKAIVAFMLLGLLLQVQTVFACQMMEHSGPIKHCCCGEMATQKQSDDEASHSPCCDIGTELTLKASDTENNEAVALQSTPVLELPQATFVFLMVSLWPEIANPPLSPESWDLDADPGTGTYLSTLRLRI